MDLGLTGRRALVLGSTEGLGLAIATQLAAEAARVVVTGRRPERVAEVASALPGAVGISGDMRDPETPSRLITEAVGLLGGLDVLVINTPGARPGGLRRRWRDPRLLTSTSSWASCTADARNHVHAVRGCGRNYLPNLLARTPNGRVKLASLPGFGQRRGNGKGSGTWLSC